MISRWQNSSLLFTTLALVVLLCLMNVSGNAQRVLDNSIIPWQGKHGLVSGGMVDEAAFDLDIRYQRMSLRTGFFAGLTIPVKTTIERSPGLQGGVFVFPNPFHSRMDPFFFMRGHVTYEESQYRSDLPANADLTNRPEGVCARVQAGYGFNINLGKYLYVQHLLGLGYGWDFLKGQAPLGKVTLMLSGGLGYHVFTHWADHKRRDKKEPAKTNIIEL